MTGSRREQREEHSDWKGIIKLFIFKFFRVSGSCALLRVRRRARHVLYSVVTAAARVPP